MTITTTDHTHQYLPHFQQLIANDVMNLQAIRTKAWDAWSRQGYPVHQMEDWKYTRLDAVKQSTFQFQTTAADKFSESLPALPSEFYSLVFVDGQLNLTLSYLPTFKTMVAQPFARSIATHADLIEQYLGKIAHENLHGFSALNLALMQEGCFIYFPANTKLDKPLQLLHLTTKTVDQQLFNYRNLIILDEGCELEIIENYQGQQANHYLMNSVTEVFIGRSSKVTHTKIQNESLQANHFAMMVVDLAEHAQLNSYALALGGNVARNEIRVNMKGEHASCLLNGLYLASGRQHLAQLTEVDHQQGHCTSQQFYRGILDQRGHGVFQGKVWVQPDAQKTVAEQVNNNLLLSRDAEINTKPQLQIYADDVQCRHGATVGQLDEEALFYLSTRGIPHEVGQGLMMYGFANQIITTLPNLSLQWYVRDLLLKRMPGQAAIEAVL